MHIDENNVYLSLSIHLWNLYNAISR